MPVIDACSERIPHDAFIFNKVAVLQDFVGISSKVFPQKTG
jgi:hypothetical protein